MLTVGVGDVWGETIYNEDFGSNTTSRTKAFSSSTDFSEETTWSIMTDGGWNQGRDASSPSDYSGASGNAYAQKSSSAGDLILVFGDLTDYTDVVLSFGYRNGAGGKVARTFAAYVSGDGGDTWTEIECNKSRKTQTWEKITYEVPAAKLTDFAVKFSNTSNNQSAVDDVILTGTAAASCSADPTVGTASLNGSISSSSIPLSISSVGGGTDCTLAEYGFVWKASSAPSASDNKTKIGESSSATSFTGSITGSFSTGVTYYIKGYAINNGSNTTLSSTALTITPQSVTFNSNGGSSVSTAYVNNGATVSKPSDPTKTGYTFGTWQLSGSDYNFSSNVTSDITLDATWNAKTTAITLNKNNSDASGSTAGSASYTFGESTKNSYTAATRAGYTLNGYYTATSEGTKILNADGTIAGNSIVVSTVTYTDGSGNWAYDGTSLTLYAQWTIKSYSVTWKVNNTNYSAGGSTSVNHGSRVATLPTAPDPGDYCGDKFVGWTTDAEYVHNTSPLFTAAGSAPVADGAQIFYAVFADYDD